MVLGGADRRVPDGALLSHFVDLAGGTAANVLVVLVFQRPRPRLFAQYQAALSWFCPRRLTVSTLNDDASRLAALRACEDATGILLVAGDVGVLARHAGECGFTQALRDASLRGACVGGVSAGASLLARHVVAEGASDIHPRAGGLSVFEGVGFFERLVIDHHYCEQHRLGRLLAIVAQQPELLGCGVEARTALVVRANQRVEVIGTGTVSVLDGRHNPEGAPVHPNAICAMRDVAFHVLPAGYGYCLETGTFLPEDTPQRAAAQLRPLMCELAGSSFARESIR